MDSRRKKVDTEENEGREEYAGMKEPIELNGGTGQLKACV